MLRTIHAPYSSPQIGLKGRMSPRAKGNGEPRAFALSVAGLTRHSCTRYAQLPGGHHAPMILKE